MELCASAPIVAAEQAHRRGLIATASEKLPEIGVCRDQDSILLLCGRCHVWVRCTAQAEVASVDRVMAGLTETVREKG